MDQAKLGKLIQDKSEEIRRQLLNKEMDLSYLTEEDYMNHLIFRELEKLVHEGEISADDVNLDF